MTRYKKCTCCQGTGKEKSTQLSNPYGGSTAWGYMTCTQCGGAGKIVDRSMGAGSSLPNGPGVKLVVWYFGAIGALFGGVLQPWGLHWLLGGFFGFLAAGMVAGFMNESRIGRIILMVLGAGIAVMVIAAIVLNGGE